MQLKSGDILLLIGKRSDAKKQYELALRSATENNLTEWIIECQIKISATLENYEQSLQILNNAYDLANQTNNSSGICDTHRELSNIYWRLGKHDTAIQQAQQSLDLARLINDRKREAMGLFFLASILSEKGDYAGSHKFFEGALAISKEINDTRRVGSTLLNWGTTHYYEGNYTTAENFLTECLAFYRDIGDKRSIAIVLNNLGNIYYLKNDFPTAEKHYKDSLALGRETDDRYIKTISLASLGITAFQQGRLADAEVYYQEGMANSRTLNHVVMTSLLHCYQGLLALAREQLSQANKSFQAGLTLAYESDTKAYIIYNLIGCACVYFAERRPTESLKLLSVSSAIADSIGFKIEPELKQPYEKTLSSIKEKMAEAEFSSRWDEGQKMTLDQAVELALKGQTA